MTAGHILWLHIVRMIESIAAILTMRLPLVVSTLISHSLLPVGRAWQAPTCRIVLLSVTSALYFDRPTLTHDDSIHFIQKRSYENTRRVHREP